MDFIAGGLVGLIGGLATASVLFGFTWWAPIVLAGAWLSTHWLLRESAVWFDRNTDVVRSAQRDADYAYRLAVDPPASKELRLFGLVEWTIERFIARRTKLHKLQYDATRLRERPLALCLLIVTAANVAVMWALAAAAADQRIGLGELVIYAQCAVGTSLIAFGGLNWALDGAAAPVAAIRAARSRPWPRKASSPTGHAVGYCVADGATSAFAASRSPIPAAEPVLEGLDLTIPAGSSLAIVGQNGAGKTTLAKLLCRFYDPQSGAIEVDGVDLRQLDVAQWRSRLAAVFQDFVRLELPLQDNVAPAGAPDRWCSTRSKPPERTGLAPLGTDPVPRLRGRHGSLGRPVAARRAGARARLRQAGRGGRPARRTHRATRRAWRGGDLRTPARRHASLHDHPHLAPLLDGAPCRSHLRPRARPGRRARHRTTS